MTGLGGVTRGHGVTGRGSGSRVDGVGGPGRVVTGVTGFTKVTGRGSRSRGVTGVTGGHGAGHRCTTELNDKVIQVVDKALSQLCLASQPANKLLPRSKKIRIDGRADPFRGASMSEPRPVHADTVCEECH